MYIHRPPRLSIMDIQKQSCEEGLTTSVLSRLSDRKLARLDPELVMAVVDGIDSSEELFGFGKSICGRINSAVEYWMAVTGNNWMRPYACDLGEDDTHRFLHVVLRRVLSKLNEMEATVQAQYDIVVHVVLQHPREDLYLPREVRDLIRSFMPRPVEYMFNRDPSYPSGFLCIVSRIG